MFTLNGPENTLPSRELTYPTWGKGKSSSKVPWDGDMLVPRRVNTTKCDATNIVCWEPTPPPELPSNKIWDLDSKVFQFFWDPNTHGIHVWYIYPLYIWLISMVNAGKYTIHGSYRIYRWTNSWCSFNLSSLTSVSKDHLWHFVHKERLPRSFQFSSHHNETSEEFQWQIGFKQNIPSRSFCQNQTLKIACLEKSLCDM